MILSSRLNYKEHIDRVRVKSKKAINTIKVVPRKNWRGGQRTIKGLYSAIFRSKSHRNKINEEADKAAKQAIDMSGMTTTRIPYTNYYFGIWRVKNSK